MNIIKSAIARIFTAIISADGVVSMSELAYLENELKPKYQLSAEDFKESEKLTFAEAVQVIRSEMDNSYFEQFGNKKILAVVDDMEDLSRVDANMQIHPREALLCLGFRLSLETDYCKIVSCYNNNLRFSKSDVLYVNTEKEQEACFKEIIDKDYYAISYMLQSFGYNFVSIPTIKETLLSYSDEYFEEIIKHFYPDHEEIETLLDALKQHLCGVSTISFSKNLFQGQGRVEPSFLIKIGSTQAKNREGMTDFILINLKKEDVLVHLQDFLFKYDCLCEENCLMVRRGRTNSEFHVKSFHRTFFEYLMQLVRKIEVPLYETIARIEFGCLGKLPINRTYDKAFYITLLYYAAKREPFITGQRRPLDVFPNDRSVMLEQYEKFCLIYDRINNGEKLKKDFNGFYSKKLSMIRNHLNECFDSVNNEYIKRFIPLYDKNNKEMNVSFSYVEMLRKPVKSVDTGENAEKEDETFWDDLIRWVDGMQ